MSPNVVGTANRFELLDLQPEVQVSEAEYHRLLGYPARHALEGRARELAGWARDWYARCGKPWVFARQVSGLDLSGAGPRTETTEFTSSPLREQLRAAQAHTAVVAAVSAGPECEAQARQLWQEGKPDEYFFLEMYGSAVVEHLVTTTGGRICAWAETNRMAVLPHYSPGYSGWDISDQIKLWLLIRANGGGSCPPGIEVLSTGMLRPKKSLLAVFGVTRHVDAVRSLASLVPCDNCALESCRYRRVPYRRSRPRIEDVRDLQSGTPRDLDSNPVRLPAPNRWTRYSVNPRALGKWSRERLKLQLLADNTVEARFVYSGTTCSNLGRPLEFIYRVRLAGAAEEYRLLEAECVPAPGDTGHQHMCGFLNNDRALMEAIAGEKPLLGRPLSDVLSWQRASSPAGCYCDADSRAHKWGLALEVIHFALAHNETEVGGTRQQAIVLE